MILMMSGATRFMRSDPQGRSASFGGFTGPRTWTSFQALIDAGQPWACDNDCFQGLDERAFRTMLTRLAALSVDERANLMFVSCPDVVCDAVATLTLFDEWEPQMHALGLPVAFVAQNGIEDMEIPWDRFDALFIGGDTAWKLGEAAARLVHEAKLCGKWVHMGRVNSAKRIAYAAAIGCDSVDGTGWSKFPSTIPVAVAALTKVNAARPAPRFVSRDPKPARRRILV